MAATLGFVSFGAQDNDLRPAKKRRFNPQSGSAIIADDASRSMEATAESTSTLAGYHKAQLPSSKRTKPATTDEITYSDSDDGTGKGDNANKNDDDFELDLDPGAPPSPSAEGTSTRTPAAAVGAVDAGGPTPTSASASASTSGPFQPSARGGRGGGRGGGVRDGGAGGGGGGANPQWYIDYYDPSSNENPWEGMEKFKGLEPVGTWLPSRWASSNDAAGVGAARQEVGAGAGGEGTVLASTATAA
ncbi:uncharacterized protein B0T15DRAFT_229023 [Chaetomium strumarium]|uniref:Uncharacterized protein n=1 Tax=Chaetomium strumarium TaxID=1170767 RepID=A0AAJ0GQ84_9PEZI|nr:hypothetical protein B0T15DRAFT_229023 [Chaetomium strumarium]